jgi:glyoxylase-like metal-dependent hydrolase (beta-lactamase superfamily II)
MPTHDSKHRSIFFGLATAGLLLLAGCGDDDSSNADTETGSTSITGTSTGVTASEPGASEDDTSSADTSTSTPGSEGSDSGTETGEAATLLQRVLAGIGGQAELDALSGVQLTASASRFVPGESVSPGDPPVAASDQDTSVSLDVDTGSVRSEITRTVLFIPQPAPFQITEIAQAGEGGWIQGVESIFGMPPQADMLSDRYASTLAQARLLNPHVLLAALSLDPSGASEAGTADFEGTTYDLLEIAADVHPITLWVDPATDLVRRLTTMENAHLRRDVELEVRYGDWQDTRSGVRFPAHVQLLIDGEPIHDETRTAFDTDPGFDADTFALPQEAAPALDPAEIARGERNHQHNQIFASIGIPVDGLQLAIVADEPAPGIHVLTGGTHHSIVVEQEGGLVLVEAPLYAQRCEAILDWAQTELPGQSFSHVVVSHHHEDHAACARTMVAAGATLVIHEASEAFFQEILARPSTIEPDALEENPVVDPEILTVPAGASLTLDDPTQPIVVYDLPNAHAADLVLPFVPSAGLAFVVDLFNPGFPGGDPAGPGAILDAFALHGITGDVQLIAGGHGFGYATLADLQAAAGG